MVKLPGKDLTKKAKGDSQRVSSRWKEAAQMKKSGKVKEKADDEAHDEHKKKATHPGICHDKKRDLADEGEKESPFEMFSRQNKESSVKQAQDGDLFQKGDVEKLSSKDKTKVCKTFCIRPKEGVDEEVKEEKAFSKPEATLLVNTDHQPCQDIKPLENTAIETETIHLSKTTPNEEMTKLAHQIVQKIVSMKSDGKNELTITIKGLENFEGGKVTITEFDTSRGQYNVEFTNLSSKAHTLVTDHENINILRGSITEKGYALHIVTATTDDRIDHVQSSDPSRREEDQPDRDSQREEDEENPHK